MIVQQMYLDELEDFVGIDMRLLGLLRRGGGRVGFDFQGSLLTTDLIAHLVSHRVPPSLIVATVVDVINDDRGGVGLRLRQHTRIRGQCDPQFTLRWRVASRGKCVANGLDCRNGAVEARNHVAYGGEVQSKKRALGVID